MILQRYIFRELLITFVVAFAILVSVCSVGLIFNMFRSTEGITLSLIFDAIPLAFAFMAPWALIVAATLAGTMVYGRLSAENEIDAMRTSGIHMGRVIAPALLFALLVFVLAFLAQHEVAPRARFARRDIAGNSILAMLSNPPGGDQNIRISGRIHLSYLDARDGEIVQPTVAEYDDDGALVRQFRGSKGIIQVLDDRTVKITIKDGNITIKKDGQETVTGIITEGSIPPIKLDNPNEKRKGAEDYTGLELVSEWSRSWGGMRDVYYTELHLRFAKSLGPMVLILLGILIGIRVRKGTKMSGLGMALPPLLLYFILFFVGQSLAQRRLVAPEIGAYSPNAVVLVAATVLAWRVLRV